MGWLFKSDNDQYSNGDIRSLDGGLYWDIDQYLILPQLTGINRFLGWVFFGINIYFDEHSTAAHYFHSASCGHKEPSVYQEPF